MLDDPIAPDPNQSYGWLNPEGSFFGCGPYQHNALAAWIGTPATELERQGWCWIGVPTFKLPDGWACSRDLTPEQQRVLARKGLLTFPIEQPPMIINSRPTRGTNV
jgi:hypothetical protein